MDKSEIIIENVRQYKCLYNLVSKDYKNVQKKNEIWERIGDIVNLSGEACRKRWKGLRDTYKRYKRSAQLASGSGAPSPTKKWKYMESLRFLDDFNYARHAVLKTEENYDDESDAAIGINQNDTDVNQFDVTIYNEHELSNEADFEIENFDLNDYVKKIDGTTNTNTNNTNPAANVSTAGNNSSANNCSRQDNEQIRRKKYDKEALIQEACNEMTTLLQNAKKHFTPPSSNQVFFNSIALQVEEANLPALTQMRLQQRILEMVTLEIVNHQQNSNNNIQHL